MQSEVKRDEIKTAVNQYCHAKGISKKDLAKQMDISPAVLSFIQNDNHTNVSDEMWLKVNNFIQPQNLSWAIIETANFRTIHAACNDARKHKKMIGIIGYTGAGKSTAIDEYYRAHANTFAIKCKMSMKPKQFFQRLLRDMGKAFTGSIYEMIEMVSKELNERESPLLIIDEAGKLSQTMLLYLHDLKDNVEKNAGIVLLGVEYFRTNLDKAVNKQKQGMPEFFRRINSWQELALPTHSEIRAIAEVNGITNPEHMKTLLKVKDFGTLYNYVNNALSNRFAE